MSTRSTRTVTLELIRLTDPPGSDTGSADGYFGPTRHYLEVEVSYDDGAALFSGSRPRGYYLRVGPVTRQTQGNGGETHGFTLFSAKSLLLAPAKRFSYTTLVKVAGAAKQHGDYESLKHAVLEKHHLTLAEGDPS